MVQWPGLCTSNAGGPGSVPAQGTESHVLPTERCVPQLKIPRAAAKTGRCQIKSVNGNKHENTQHFFSE